MRLVARREVWLPTWQGALLLLVLLAAAVIGAGRGAYAFLAPQSPAPGARTLVVEGWLDEGELRQAVQAFRRGRYERVLTTGGPIAASIDPQGDGTYAQRAAARLAANGLAGVPLIAVASPPGERDRTYRSALAVRAWAAAAGVELGAVDLYSAGVHARRSRMLFRMALGERSDVGVLAAVPSDVETQRWWASSEAAKQTLGEGLGLAWTVCCFWPGAPP